MNEHNQGRAPRGSWQLATAKTDLESEQNSMTRARKPRRNELANQQISGAVQCTFSMEYSEKIAGAIWCEVGLEEVIRSNGMSQREGGVQAVPGGGLVDNGPQ